MTGGETDDKHDQKMTPELFVFRKKSLHLLINLVLHCFANFWGEPPVLTRGWYQQWIQFALLSES
jgi:hypothetical protein